jgi:peptidoglycan hydrolase-like protein with peptidoglycan-binding domain
MRFKLLCCAALVLFSSGHGALAQPEPPQSMPIPPAKPADAGFEAAKAAFEALPQAERKAIQDALIWTGDYNGTVTGDFGRRTFEAISAYARRAGLLATGMLDPASRKTLLAAAQREREAAKFTLARDAATGIRIGVPERVLVRREGNPSGGTRWQGADGKITLDTRAIAPGAGDLTSLFERNLSVQAPGRRVTYKLLRPDFFVVAGETPAGKFYTRYALGPAGLRGFSVSYDKSLAKGFDRIALAIANSFVPFPKEVPPIADARPAISNEATPAMLDPPRAAGLVGSGIAVSSALVVTIGTSEPCEEPRVAGVPARVVRIDSPTGLVLLERHAGASANGSALGSGATSDLGALLVLSYYAASDRPEELMVTPAHASGTRLVAPLQPNANGGAVFDRMGAFIGLVGVTTEEPRKVAGIVPPRTWPLISTETIRTFLGDSVVDPSPPSAAIASSAGDIATRWRARILPITCG